MAWTAPITFADGNVITAAQMNTYLRDNMLETMPAKATTSGGYFVATGKNRIVERVAQKQTIATSETTTNVSYEDLATVGPAVTVTCGTQALVLFGMDSSSSTANFVCCSPEVSIAAADDTGDSTPQVLIAPDDSYACVHETSVANHALQNSHHIYFAGLTPGSLTFTLKYRTAAGTATISRRRISVLPY